MTLYCDICGKPITDLLMGLKGELNLDLPIEARKYADSWCGPKDSRHWVVVPWPEGYKPKNNDKKKMSAETMQKKLELLMAEHEVLDIYAAMENNDDPEVVIAFLRGVTTMTAKAIKKIEEEQA